MMAASMSRDPTLVPYDGNQSLLVPRSLSGATVFQVGNSSPCSGTCTPKSEKALKASKSSGDDGLGEESTPGQVEKTPSQPHKICTGQTGKGKFFNRRKIASYFAADVRQDWFLEAELLVLAFSTGIQDASTYPDFRCFASNQTGNTVLLAVGYAGLLDPSAFIVVNTWISLGLFILGALCAGQIGNLLGRRRRATCFVSSFIQTCLVIGTVIIEHLSAAERGRAGQVMTHFSYHSSNGGIYTPARVAGLGMLAFSSGAQVAMARATGINEITTAMATSAYVDLLVDPGLIIPRNRGRNRRTLFLISLFAGSFAGAYTAATYGLTFSLLISAVGKIMVTIAILFNKEQPRQPERDGDESLA